MHIDKMKRRAKIGSVDMRMPFAPHLRVCWLWQDHEVRPRRCSVRSAQWVLAAVYDTGVSRGDL